MATLRFPADRIVGQLDWLGSYTAERGPVLATGTVVVPDGQPVSLSVSSITDKVRHGETWQLSGDLEPVDLGFLGDLPPDALGSLTLRAATPDSYGAIAHLALGLRTLQLAWADLTDAVLPVVAQLTGLTMLQTYGNDFTDDGVQVLAALTSLTSLYLEEETLSAAGFRFVTELPRLARLGLQDVQISDEEIEQLRHRLPGVAVSR